VQTTHETRQEPIIEIGPNMQFRADQIGGRLVDVIAKQAEVVSLSLRLYKMYRTECKQRGLRPKGVELQSCLGRWRLTSFTTYAARRS